MARIKRVSQPNSTAWGMAYAKDTVPADRFFYFPGTWIFFVGGLRKKFFCSLFPFFSGKSLKVLQIGLVIIASYVILYRTFQQSQPLNS